VSPSLPPPFFLPFPHHRALALTYRIGFGADVNLYMSPTVNGSYMAVIPGTAFTPGALVRWSVK
jgi:hypothetical protein